MIHGSVLLCIVPSTMALSPQCPTVPLSQYAILHCPTVPFSLSHGPIVRVSIVPASKVPLSIVSQPELSHCPFSHCPASQCPLPRCLLSDVVFGLGWNELLSKGNTSSVSGVLRSLEAFNLMLRGPVYSCVDSHTSRMLKLSASSLATYNHTHVSFLMT
jgi:hypothetical protein